MFTHALRCIEADLPELLHNAQLLGVMDIVAGQVVMRHGGAWDVIGPKEIDPEGQPGVYLTDGNGNTYMHINARTPLDIDAIARELANTYPEIATGLVQFNRFFIVDEVTGKWVWPANPLRVFA